MLVRHAKAEPDAATDAERPLTRRGARDAAAVGRWLRDADLHPDVAVVSPAVRARQTWEQAASALGETSEPVVDERLYANTVDDVLAAVRSTAAGVTTLALVGHNPSIGELAAALADNADDFDEGYPTAAVAVFGVGDWASVGDGSATLERFTVARG